MTAAFVIDVNVLVTANGRHPAAGPGHRKTCLDAIEEIRAGITCLDRENRILGEYRKHLSPSGQPGVGDRFMRWLLQNQFTETCCERVPITPCPHDDQDFEEFPRAPELKGFHGKDRKYVAVAAASAHSPEVLNATDSDYWHFNDALLRNGIRVRFLCPDLAKKEPK